MPTPDAEPNRTSEPGQEAAPLAVGAGSCSQGGARALFIAGGLSALATWAVIIASDFPFFKGSPSGAGGSTPQAPSAEDLALALRVARLNAASLMALSGGLLGIGLALGDSVRRHAAKGVALAVLATGIGGGFAGAAAGWCVPWMLTLPHFHQLESVYAPARDIMVQAGCWGFTGLAIGLGLTLSACRARRAILGGVLAGAFSALVFAFMSAVVGIIVPAGDDGGLLPDSTANRLVWLLSAVFCLAAGISLIAPRPAANA